ncbi:MAG: glutaredoxin [Rhodospirillaceae bacterium]|jgi:glutaredoxin|nr:glutaredoxin [Rhodospirillaceae bacterium]
MNFVRWILGRLVLGYDLLTRPKPLTRDAAAQQELDGMTAKFALYQFNACPFCVKVRRQIRRHALKIELRDARNDETHKQALIEGGGRHKVPCLRVTNPAGDDTWLYESDDIISYLNTELKLA